MKWQILSFEEHAAKYQAAWDDLVNTQHENNPMLLSSFCFPLVCRSTNETKLAILFDSNSIVCAAVIEKSSILKWSVAKPAQCQVALWVGDFQSTECISLLFKALPSCQLIDCIGVDPRFTPSLLSQSVATHISVHNTTITIEDLTSIERYWDSRNRKLRQNIRRYRRKLDSESSPIELKVYDQMDQIKTAIDDYGFLESRGWKGENGTALHPGNFQGNFYRQTIGDLTQKISVFVFELYYGEELVASRIVAGDERQLVMLKTTYDEKYKKLAFGRVLLAMVIEYIITHRLTAKIDFYTDATVEQKEWSTHERDISAVTYMRNAGISLLYKGIKKVRGLLK